MVRKLLFDHIGAAWTARELASLPSKIPKLKAVAEETCASHRSSGLFTLKLYLFDHVLEDLERFGSFSLTDAAPFDHWTVLMKRLTR